MRKTENEKGSPRPAVLTRLKRKFVSAKFSRKRRIRMVRQRAFGSVIGRKRGLALVIACISIWAASIYAGYEMAPEDTRHPVLLSNGEVILQPCYVAVEGECIALVKNEATAEEVVDRVKAEYKNDDTVKVEIEENTSIENLELENGAEKPEILTARQASEQIVNKQSLTVKTTEVVEVEQTVAYKTIEKESDQMNLGESKVQQQGQAGIKRVKKKVVKENGIVISEDVLRQETLVESVPEIVISGTAGLVQPVNGFTLTSEFGPRWGRQHYGIDMALEAGSPISAAKDGVVTWAGYKDSYGNLVIIDHGDGMETYYAHCSRLDVLAGDAVGAGQRIAAVGSTGNSTGPHLHFEVRIDGVARDPAGWLQLE